VAAVDGAGWRSRGACVSADPDLFFPISPGGASQRQVAQAKAVCARCGVRAECLAFAVETRQAHGVWGGLAEEERARLRRSLRAPGGSPLRPHLPGTDPDQGLTTGGQPGRPQARPGQDLREHRGAGRRDVPDDEERRLLLGRGNRPG
jgi:WhiB family redox-sensing transcriptional regulator